MEQTRSGYLVKYIMRMKDNEDNGEYCIYRGSLEHDNVTRLEVYREILRKEKFDRRRKHHKVSLQTSFGLNKGRK